MSRPKKPRRLCFQPNVRYFKPVGVPLRSLKEVVLTHDEIEAIKLHDVDQLDQIAAAQSMHISQSTFARILKSAYRKVAIGLIRGQAIKIVIH